MSDKPAVRRLLRLGALLFWVGVWYAAALAVNKELLIPTPAQVAVTWWGLIRTAAFWRAVAASLGRIVAGFAAGVLAGTALGALTAHYPLAAHLFSPLLRVIRATPVASFIILALVWLKTDTLPIFIAFLMVLPVVWGNVDKGFRTVDHALLEMARVFHLSRFRVVAQIRLPTVRPYLLSGCTTALGLAWKSGIAAEVICRPTDSLGRLLQTAKNTLETPQVFAYTLTVILLSVFLEQLLLRLTRKKEVAA